MSKASDEANKVKYYRHIMQAQHALELKQDNLECVEDKNYYFN